MEIILYILAAVIVIFILMVAFAPRHYHVYRSVLIDRPLEEVFDYIRYVRNQDHWSPWKKRDPNMEQTFTGQDGQVGFVAAWDGNKQVGTGEQEIVGISPNKRVDSKLRFYKPWKSQSDAYFDLAEQDGKTMVTWGFSGENKPPVNAMMLFMNMDKMVGRDFEAGLAELKNILENQEQ